MWVFLSNMKNCIVLLNIQTLLKKWNALEYQFLPPEEVFNFFPWVTGFFVANFLAAEAYSLLLFRGTANLNIVR